jgi:hypothetical protein
MSDRLRIETVVDSSERLALQRQIVSAVTDIATELMRLSGSINIAPSVTINGSISVVAAGPAVEIGTPKRKSRRKSKP